MLSARDRKALKGADDRDGIKRGDSAFYGLGEQTLSSLIERGLLEKFPHPVSSEPLYRTTAAGKDALRSPDLKPARTRAKLKMLKPIVRTLDTRTVKPLKGR